MAQHPKLGAGDAIAAGGIVLSAATLLASTGPGHAALLAADHDGDIAEQLHVAELVSSVVILTAAAVMSGLLRRGWPLGVAVVGLAVAAGTHEAMLRLPPNEPDPAS